MPAPSWRLLVVATLLPLAVTAPSASGAGALGQRGQVVADPGFEDPTVAPCFVGTGGAGVTRTTTDPLAGERSLEVSLPVGAAATCAHAWSGSPEAARLTGRLWVANPGVRPVVACLRASVVGTSSALRDCTRVPPGDLRRLRLHVLLGGREVRSAAWRVSAGGGTSTARLDEARLSLTRSSGCAAPALGPPVAGSPCDQNDDAGGSAYTPAALVLPDQRPYLPLDAYTVAPATDPVATRFKQYVDRALAGDPDYGYSPTDAVTLYARTGATKYLDAAIEQVDAKVHEAEDAIRSGQAPPIAGDSYLEVGPLLEEVALAFDWGQDRLTRSQRQRWVRYADQTLANLWSPDLERWGTREDPGDYGWSAWSINNPGNNYNFSFLQATETWAIASRHAGWMRFLQERKFPLLDTYYRQIDGGGSREGTGYGTAQTRLWANARTWADATGEHLAAVEEHARDSVDYWINATVPTLDLFAPIGDLSRESFPHLYDYQENLVREAAMAAPGTPEAGRALWWIAHNSVPDTMANSFNLRPALLRPTGTATKPTALGYHATGVGQVFLRTSTAQDATWLSVVAGPYDESHAHMEQGAFNLYDEEFLAVTANVWSHSGLQGNSQGKPEDGDEWDLGTGAGSMLRFDGPEGTIGQDNATSTMTTSGSTVDADLSPAYVSSDGLVGSWTRHLVLGDGSLSVTDACQAAPSVTPVWQLQLPTRPTVTSPGHVSAGRLTVAYDPAYGVEVVKLEAINQDLLDGWRLELTNDDACAFAVDLHVS